MSGIESISALVELLRNNPESCNWTGGLSAQDISQVEDQLSVSFPPSYRYFLSELGSCEAGSTEFLGICRTPAMGNTLLGTVAETGWAAWFPSTFRTATTRASHRSSHGTRAPLPEGDPNHSPRTSAHTSYGSAPRR
jgi:hypothetical protein